MENTDSKTVLNSADCDDNEPLEAPSQDFLLNLMHNLPGMAYRCVNDADWTMVFLSEGVEELTGYRIRDLLQNRILSYQELIYEEDRSSVRQEIDSAVSENRTFRIEYRIRCKNGAIKWVLEKGSAVNNRDGIPEYLDGFITDLSYKKEAEETQSKLAADLQEMNRTKDRFFSLLAHDLQNPVYAIITLSEFVAENLNTFGMKEIEDSMLQINSASRGIYTLLENLLDWAQLQTGRLQYQKEFVSLSKVISYAIAYYKRSANQKDIVISFDEEQDFLVESDLQLLSSMLRNLISNALKYSYPKSEIKLILKKNGDYAMICVKDNGTGIARPHLPTLFTIDSELRQYGTANESGS